MRGPLVLVVFLGSHSAFGATGLVLLPDGTPAADVTVAILGQTGSTRTGRDGRFTWTPDPVPPFDVLLILPGGLYTHPITIPALPKDGTPFVVKIEAAVSVTVTVDAGATPFTEAPPASAATILTARSLEESHPDNLTRAIEAIPGVGRLEEGHAAAPSIRGLARGRTLVLVDGARVTTERRAGPSATFLDPSELESVEVARGFGSVAWGSDAFGGVIHARTRGAAPGSPLAAQVSGSVGTGVPERRIAGQASRGFAEGGLALQARYRSFEDYEGPQGTVLNSSFRDAGLHGRFDHEWGPGRASVQWQSDWARDIGKPAQDSNVVRAYYPREDSHRLTLRYDGDPKGAFSRWGILGFVGTHRLVTIRDRFATTTAPRQAGETDVSAWDWALRATGARSVGGFRLEGGLDLSGRSGLEALGAQDVYDSQGGLQSHTTEVSVADASRSDAGLFVTLDGRLSSRLLLSAGGRIDRVTAENHGGYFGDRHTDHHALSGLVALTAGPFLRTTLTAQAGHGFRDPTLSDRYFRGVSGRGFVTGEPELEPESSLQFDLAARRPGRVRTALYLYRYRIADLVERYRVGSDFFFRNRGEALLRGIELEAQAEVAKVIVELGAQAATGEARDDGSPLADVPERALTLTLRRSIGSRGDAAVRGVLRDRDERPGPTETVTPSHGTLDAAFTWRFGRRWEARVAVENVFDAAYPQTADELTALAPGRAASLTLTARF